MTNAIMNTIADYNDAVRTSLGILTKHWAEMSAGIAALPEDVTVKVLTAVRFFTEFTEDNDLYDEHDFGSLEVEGAGKIFWKIDYYDNDLAYGSPDPTDEDVTTRVITIMLAAEWPGRAAREAGRHHTSVHKR